MTTRTNSDPQGFTNTLITRKQLSARWDCCAMTLKRREAAGILTAVRFNSRMLRYRLSEILAIEAAAGGAAQ
jgi:hypothetical protein